MARQIKEDRAVPEGRRKTVPTRAEQREGGRAIPVNEEAGQLELRIETAEEAARAVTDGGSAFSQRKAGPRAEPKSKRKDEQVPSVTMEEVARGLRQAFQTLDAHIRRRLRAIQLKHWKTKRTIARRLIRLGIRRQTAWRRVYEGRKSLWALSHAPVVDRALRNAYFAERGLLSLTDGWRAKAQRIVAPEQLAFALG